MFCFCVSRAMSHSLEEEYERVIRSSSMRGLLLSLRGVVKGHYVMAKCALASFIACLSHGDRCLVVRCDPGTEHVTGILIAFGILVVWQQIKLCVASVIMYG